jgi:hypothetical protein
MGFVFRRRVSFPLSFFLPFFSFLVLLICMFQRRFSLGFSVFSCFGSCLVSFLERRKKLLHIHIFGLSPSIAARRLFLFLKQEREREINISICSFPMAIALATFIFPSLCNVDRTYRQNSGSQISLSSTKNR